MTRGVVKVPNVDTTPGPGKKATSGFEGREVNQKKKKKRKESDEQERSAIYIEFEFSCCPD